MLTKENVNTQEKPKYIRVRTVGVSTMCCGSTVTGSRLLLLAVYKVLLLTAILGIYRERHINATNWNGLQPIVGKI
jgi:hypothetical protein